MCTGKKNSLHNVLLHILPLYHYTTETETSSDKVLSPDKYECLINTKSWYTCVTSV